MTDPLDALRWAAVPEDAVRLAKLAAARYAHASRALGDDPAEVWLHAEDGRLVTDCVRAATKLAAARQTGLLPGGEPWVRVKGAGWTARSVFNPMAQAMQLAPSKLNEPFGGPTPLASSLAGGLLGAGAGYVGGALAENLLPRSVIERGKLRKLTALAGGALGAAPGVALGLSSGSFTDPNPIMGGPRDVPVDLADDLDPANDRAWGLDKLATAAEGLELALWGVEVEPLMKAAADVGGAGGLFIPTIPVDAFNRVILADPFSPPALSAATVGLITAADAAKGGLGVVSPWDITRIAVGMGAGLSQAYLGGKVLGALAGLTPAAQTQLVRAGTLAGALKAVVPGLFGG